jgi:hypothetical protein
MILVSALNSIGLSWHTGYSSDTLTAHGWIRNCALALTFSGAPQSASNEPFGPLLFPSDPC